MSDIIERIVSCGKWLARKALNEDQLSAFQWYRRERPAGAPTFADGMTGDDDRRFLELTNDLTHNVELTGAARHEKEQA